MKLHVATRKNGRLNWKDKRYFDAKGLSYWTIKKYYHTKPERFLEDEEGNLYYISVQSSEQKHIVMLLRAALKISGTRYALALALSHGDRQSAEFSRNFRSIKNQSFKDKHEWIRKLENYIKQNGIPSAVRNDGKLYWILQDDYAPIKTKTLKEYYSRNRNNFIEIDDTLYFLANNHILLENMFFRAVEIVGSEHALAVKLSCGDERQKNRHLKNFQRMGFKKQKNFIEYMNLFSLVIRNHKTLFEDPIYAC